MRQSTWNAALALLFASASVVSSSSAASTESCTESRTSHYDSDQIAKDYANMKNTNPHFRNDRYTLEQSIGALDGLDLLDLATGDGYYARHFKRRGAKRVLGVDLSLDMVTLAKAAESKEPLGITYETGDCKSLTKLGLGSFDVATASYLLNYVPAEEMADTLKGVVDVLKEGGRFVGLTINPVGGLPDYPKDWFSKFGINCYGFPDGRRESVVSGGMISCDINKMDDTADPIHLDTFYHDSQTYEHAAKQAGFSSFEWVPIKRHPDHGDWPQEYFDWHIAMGYIATK